MKHVIGPAILVWMLAGAAAAQTTPDPAPPPAMAPVQAEIPAAIPPVQDRLPVAEPRPDFQAVQAPLYLQAPGLPEWAISLLILFGAFLAGLFGILAMILVRRHERRERRRAVAFCLATELETRRMAFDAVPLPPNAEAGVSFVSSVTALSGIDPAFRSVQSDLALLPPKLAASLAIHYAAVQRVSDFVKGQSLASAVRMLQANRMGGYPCPDAAAMREAYEELTVAFRGTEKVAQSLRSLSD